MMDMETFDFDKFIDEVNARKHFYTLKSFADCVKYFDTKIRKQVERQGWRVIKRTLQPGQELFGQFPVPNMTYMYIYLWGDLELLAEIPRSKFNMLAENNDNFRLDKEKYNYLLLIAGDDIAYSQNKLDRFIDENLKENYVKNILEDAFKSGKKEDRRVVV